MCHGICARFSGYHIYYRSQDEEQDNHNEHNDEKNDNSHPLPLVCNTKNEYNNDDENLPYIFPSLAGEA